MVLAKDLKDEHLGILNQGVEVWNEWRRSNPNVYPYLNGADLRSKRLTGANLSGANLGGANLVKAELYDADLRYAELRATNLAFAGLSGANLEGAYLESATLNQAELDNANLFRVKIGWTVFANNDLRSVKGLDTVTHQGPSTIGVDTLYRSGGQIPEVFLRGCGLSDDFIVYIRSLVIQPIQFYSCFISYSSKDQIFTEQLYTDLQNKGVRCWYAPEKLKIGDKIRVGIDESIYIHDKLLLVLSKYSVESEWVEKEVETAMEKERKQKRIVLFPIRLDDTVMAIESGWPADIRRARHIGDFKKWKNYDAYQKALDRLVHDLMTE